MNEWMEIREWIDCIIEKGWTEWMEMRRLNRFHHRKRMELINGNDENGSISSERKWWGWMNENDESGSNNFTRGKFHNFNRFHQTEKGCGLLTYGPVTDDNALDGLHVEGSMGNLTDGAAALADRAARHRQGCSRPGVKFWNSKTRQVCPFLKCRTGTNDARANL